MGLRDGAEHDPRMLPHLRVLTGAGVGMQPRHHLPGGGVGSAFSARWAVGPVDLIVEVWRTRGLSAAREIGRRADDDKSLLWADSDRDHLTIETVAEADARVEALGDDVRESFVEREVDADVGIGGEEARQLWFEDVGVTGPEHRQA